MSAPLVSICLPIYNGSAYLAAAMDSAIGQSYRPLEIVVSDDMSSDNSVEIVESYRQKTDIPIHIYSHQPMGIGANWNNSIRHAKGDYIKLLFQDDLLRPECVAEMVALAIKDSKIGMVFCRRSILHDEQNAGHLKWLKRCRHVHAGWSELKSINNGKDLLADPKFLDVPSNKIGEPPATLIRKDVFQTIGWFNELSKQVLDYEFYYRLMVDYSVGFIDKELVTFRLHPQQATAVNSSMGIFAQEKEWLMTSLYYDKIFHYLSFGNKIKLIRRNNKLVQRLKKLIRN